MACYAPCEVTQDPDAPVLAPLRSIIAIFDVNRLDKAIIVLQHEGEITVECFGPYREPFAICGTADGSVHAWDLRSSFGCVGLRYVGDNQHAVKLFTPHYSTCALDNSHDAPIVAMNIAHVRSQDSLHASAFQLASMDDRGVVIIWSVLEVAAGDEALLADKCAQVGGRIKLVMNSVIETDRWIAPKLRPHLLSTRAGSQRTITAQPLLGIGSIATTMQFYPDDTNQFLVGLSTGVILHGHRLSTASSSSSIKKYRRDRNAGTWSNIAAVTCIDFHPVLTDYFLVGYADGVVSLFRTSAALCMTSYEIDSASDCIVEQVQWLPRRPSIFLASYADGKLLAWDLKGQVETPVFSFQMNKSDPDPSCAIRNGFSLSSDNVRTSRAAIAYARTDSASPLAFIVDALTPDFTDTQPCDTSEALHQTLASVL